MRKSFKKSAAPALSEAEQALQRWDIRYEKQPDGTLLVRGNLNIAGMGLTQLPDLSSVTVRGSFFCQANRLTSLKGSPQTVDGEFYCTNNELTSLEGAPQAVGDTFSCHSNQLTSLKGAPRSVGRDFQCMYNQLTSLEHAPAAVGVNFDCSHNALTSLEHSPPAVNGYFNCSDNRLTSLEHAPSSVRTTFYCEDNQLTSLDDAPTVFKELKSDLGAFSGRQAIPKNLFESPEIKAQKERERKMRTEEEIRDTLVLKAPIAVKGPLQIQRRGLP